MPSLSLRVNLDPQGRIGPGKIELLEQIAAFGSISAGARRMEMSYKHAWDLVEEMNRIFGKPVVAAQTGGKRGGGGCEASHGCLAGRHRRWLRSVGSSSRVLSSPVNGEKEDP